MFTDTIFLHFLGSTEASVLYRRICLPLGLRSIPKTSTRATKFGDFNQHPRAWRPCQHLAIAMFAFGPFENAKYSSIQVGDQSGCWPRAASHFTDFPEAHVFSLSSHCPSSGAVRPFAFRQRPAGPFGPPAGDLGLRLSHIELQAL